MKKSDIGVITVIYATCLFFYVMLLGLPSAAQTYPLALIGALFFLNTLYLLLQLVRLKKKGIVNDLPAIFKGFLPGQFFMVCATGAAYMILMYIIGFYPATVAYLVVTMWLLKVPKIQLFVTLAALLILIYAVFSLFLAVPLPQGILFK